MIQLSRSRLARFLHRLAQGCRSRGDVQLAAGAYRWAIAIAPLPLGSEIGCDYGGWLMRQEHWDAAIAAYRRVVRRDHNCGEAWFQLAGLLAHRQGHAAAVESYLEAVRCNPAHPWFYQNGLWETLAATAQLPQLRAHLTHILDRRGGTMRYRERADIRLNLGEVLTREGQIAAAAATYRQAMHDRLVQHDRRFLAELWHPKGDRNPDFIIIGAGKCGTTSLFYYLMQHPNVLPSLRKEVNFWSSATDYGVEWYRSQLPPHPPTGHWLSGESSPSYFNSHSAPARLAQVLPSIRLIVLLRNPVNRVISRLYHLQRIHQEFRSPDIVVDDLLKTFAHNPESPDVEDLTSGFYAQHLRRWFRNFEQSQLLILHAEMLFMQPDHTMTKVHQFLNIPHISLNNYRPYNVGDYPEIEASVCIKLTEFFAPYNQDLENLLDRSFSWQSSVH